MAQPKDDFAELFNKLTVKHAPWEAWHDTILLIATAMSNAVDKRYFDEREQRYLETIRRYSPEEQQIFPQLFGCLQGIFDIAQNGDWKMTDFLGELYMQCGLHIKGKAQFFTPVNVAKLMAKLSFDTDAAKRQIEQHGYLAIHDPACGAGATLIAAADTLLHAGVNFQQYCIFTGQEIDETTAMMCYIQLSLLGCAGYVIIGDTLHEPMTGDVLDGEDSARCWYTPMWFDDHWSWLRAARLCRRFMAITGTTYPKPEPESAKPMVVTAEQMTMF